MKNGIGNYVKGIVFVLSVLSLVACSRGHSRPEGYQNDTYLKQRCASPRAFNLENENARRAVLIAEKAPDRKAAESSLYIRETITRERMAADPMAKDTGKKPPMVVVETTSEEPTEKSADSFSRGSGNAMDVELKCGTLEATYTGPGFAGPIVGKLTEIKINSVTLEAKSDTGEVITVKVEKYRPNAYEKKADFFNFKKDNAQGIVKFTATIEHEHDDMKDVTTVTQETVARSLGSMQKEIETNLKAQQQPVEQPQPPAAVVQPEEPPQPQPAAQPEPPAS